MNEPIQNLREARWRRELTPEEAAKLREWLKANPAAREDWQLESALSHELTRLPNAPVPSNFTARVLQAVELENAPARRAPVSRWRWILRSLAPKTAFAAALLCVGFFSYHEARDLKRAQLARSVATVSEVASLPGPEVLRDFDAIQQMNATPPPDNELLALLK